MPGHLSGRSSLPLPPAPCPQTSLASAQERAAASAARDGGDDRRALEAAVARISTRVQGIGAALARDEAALAKQLSASVSAGVLPRHGASQGFKPEAGEGEPRMEPRPLCVLVSAPPSLEQALRIKLLQSDVEAAAEALAAADAELAAASASAASGKTLFEEGPFDARALQHAIASAW